MDDIFIPAAGKKALSIFYTAGYPRINDTVAILERLAASGVDMVEIGFPFSDPVADGPTIQDSNTVSIHNGMNLKTLFEQLLDMRKRVSMRVLLMGYLNPVERFGVERFFAECANVGIDGVILPDLPFDEYRERYKALYTKHGIKPVFLVTPRTEAARVRDFDKEAPAFLYLLSSDAVTGGSVTVSADREDFFRRISEMGLKSPLVVGFGVRDRASFESVTKFTHGAIIGSAFVKAISDVPPQLDDVTRSDFKDTEVIERFIAGIQEVV
jgi:tryptophan synthase alpha chain